MNEPIFVLNKKIFDSQAMSSNLSSEVIDIAEILGFAVHLIWTGSPVGTFSLQASNNGIDFVEFNSVAAGGTSGQNMVNIEYPRYRYFKASYTYSGGSGTLTGYLSGKK